MSLNTAVREANRAGQLVGLKEATFNGLEGNILFEDKRSKRIPVQLDKGSPPIKVKLRNLEYWQTQTGYYSKS